MSILTSLVALAALLFYILIVLLPDPLCRGTGSGNRRECGAQTTRPPAAERDVSLFGVTWKMSDENGFSFW